MNTRQSGASVTLSEYGSDACTARAVQRVTAHAASAPATEIVMDEDEAELQETEAADRTQTTSRRRHGRVRRSR